MGNEFVLGGQAVIEGVMMKGRKNYAIAIRTTKGKIKTKTEKIKSITQHKFFRLPVIRGIVTLIEVMILGMKAISWSTDEQLEKEEKISTGGMVATIAFSLVLAFLLFKLLPLGITRLIFGKEGNQFLFNIVDGTIRILVFLAYIWIISLSKEIRRVFEYHGAEHMTVYCHEAGKKLTVENVRKYETRHPRCGTSFMLIVLIVSILIFALVPVKLPFYLLLLYRLPLILPIAGIAYEFLKLSAKLKNMAIFKVIIWPGIMLQKITTRKPDDKQIEVAIAAAKLLLKKEQSI
jgi:uncharacterized protein YqhQ